MQKTVPVPPEQRANMEAAMARPATRGNADHVRERMAALKGQSRSDVRSDVSRGAGSPLGYGKTKKTKREMEGDRGRRQ